MKASTLCDLLFVFVFVIVVLLFLFSMRPCFKLTTIGEDRTWPATAIDQIIMLCRQQI